MSFNPLISLARNAKRQRMEMQCDPQWVLDLAAERDQLRAELYDEVWQKTRDLGYGNVTDALVELERIKSAQPAAGVSEGACPVCEGRRVIYDSYAGDDYRCEHCDGSGSVEFLTPPAFDQMTDAARDVLAERHRQVEDEQWTPEHDDRYRHRQLAMAAACYAAAVPVHDVLDYSDGKIENRVPVMPSAWPWAMAWWKPGTARQNLVKAGALILAEIERLDRATATGLPAGRPSEAEESQP